MAEGNKSMLVTIAQSISMVITFVLVFIGSLYAHNSWIVSIIISALSILLVFVLINHFIEQKERLNRTGYKLKTYLFLFLYALLIVPTSFYGIHAFNVEFYEKAKTIENAEKKILYIKSLENQYDTKYKNFIENNKSEITKLNSEARALIQTSSTPLVQTRTIDMVKNDLQSAPLKLSPGAVNSMLNCDVSQVVGVINAGYVAPMDTAFSSVKRRIQGNFIELNDLDTKIHKWNRFTIAKTMGLLNNRLEQERDSLTLQLDQMTYQMESMKNIPSPKFDESKLNAPVKLFFENQDPLIYVLIFIFQSLLLLPYWLTRKPRYKSNSSKNESSLDSFSRSL